MSETQSLAQLLKQAWKGAVPTRGTDSGTICRLYELWNTPIHKMDLADIRFLIGQNMALEHLVPIALNALKRDLFLEVEYYPCDLFSILLSINDDGNYWNQHPKEKLMLNEIYTQQIARTNTHKSNTRTAQKLWNQFQERQ